MSKITRAQFMNDFSSGEMNVRTLSTETLSKLKNAGVEKSDLERIAGTDGKISGAEYAALFGYIDGFEDGAPNDFFDTRDNKNQPTTSGEVYDALKTEFDRNVSKARVQGTQTAKGATNPPPVDQFQTASKADIDRANDVLKKSPQVAGNDPHAQHVSQVQANLKGILPKGAKGVSVIVIGESDPKHAEAITRTIAGKTGLAKDASVHLQSDGGFAAPYKANHAYTKELNSKSAGATVTVTDLAKMGVVHAEATVHKATEEIRALRGRIPADGKTRIGTISWGQSPVAVAKQMLGQVPNDSSIVRKAGMEWAIINKTKYDPNDSIHVMFARTRVAEQIANEMKTLHGEKGNKEQMSRLKSGLENELALARQKGLLVFNAAGNDREVAQDVMGDPKHSTTYFDSVKGFISVGSANLKSPKTAADDEIAAHSAEGNVHIAAPGVDLPVAVENNKAAKVSGTSFAAPYAASVAALMVAANPKITPAQIEAILTNGRVTTDLAGNRDGKGLLDPVKAVKEAKNLVTP